MNLNKNIAAFAVAAIILSMNGFNSEAKTLEDTYYKKHDNLKVVKIPSKRHHLHDKFIGNNRYETSFKILEQYKNKDTLILVDASENMSDGLSAAALSGKLNANIVPINPDNLDEASKRMIDDAKEVFLIGGYNAIPKEFEESLSGKKIVRIGGKDRVETSKNIAKFIGNYKKAYIVNGYTGQADAMSIAPVSARDVSPIILTKADKTNINKEKNVDYTVIGGKDAVSNNVQQSTSSDRIGGKNRYETNRMVLDKFYKNRKEISFCNGETLVDALSGTYFARNNGIALINSKENLHLLENINTNQLGGLPIDIKFVVPETVANVGRNPIIKDNHKPKKDNHKPNETKEKEINTGNKKDEKVTEKENNDNKVKESDKLAEGNIFNEKVSSLSDFSKANKIAFDKQIPSDLDKLDYINIDNLGKGSIVAYIKDNTIHISSKEKIYANEYSFDFMKDFDSIEDIDLGNLDTSRVKNMNGFFNGCSKLRTVDLSSLNTSNVEDMGFMFSNCTNLQNMDLSKLKTEKVKDMSNMFFKCSSLSEVNMIGLDTSNVTNMSCMFGDCANLNKVKLENLDTKKVEDMNKLFYNCSNLENIELSNVETDNVKDMGYMFGNCSKLNELNLINFNTKEVENMSYMFANCYSLKNVDLENLETEKVINMSYMFYGCRDLNSSITIENDVTNYNNMFDYCSIEEGSKFIVNYKKPELKQTIENMIKTKSDFSNVEIGTVL